LGSPYAQISGTKELAGSRVSASRVTLVTLLSVFAATFFILFLGMSLYPNIYDESLVLTGAMRVAAGQVPHRDFYANYGPAQFYLLAGLFRVFGESVLIGRLFDLTVKALLVTVIYRTVSSYGRRSFALGVCAVAILWIEGVNGLTGTPVITLSLLSLVGSLILLPIFECKVSPARMCVVGAIAGVAALFRYDVGIALFGVYGCVIAAATYVRSDDGTGWMRRLTAALLPYIAGYALVLVPVGLVYLSAGVAQPFLHDIILYPGKYYHRGRNLPFPRIYLKGIDNLGVYLPLVIASLSLWVSAIALPRIRRENVSDSKGEFEERRVVAFLITFGVMSLAMYVKGLVRISVPHLYLAIIPSVLLVAVLFQYRSIVFPRLRVFISVLALLFAVAAGWSALREMKSLHLDHASIPDVMVRFVRGQETGVEKTWCKRESAETKGICFLSDEGHLRTIEFIEDHTSPEQKVYVGLTKHDRIFANDNLIYFASQRLPATKWSHFDPGLQNSYDIQKEMVHELDVNVPPYIVLDSEFELIREPNDSSKSTGVTLLDDYLESKYRIVETYGTMSIWQRIPPQ
jgi:hypothetical protein